jgi:hypothetical protein
VTTANGEAALRHDLHPVDRWPHLRRPGPQPSNQIGTLRQQLRKARRGRRRKAGCQDCRRLRRHLGRLLVLALDKDLGAATALAALLKEVADGAR